MRVKLCGRRWNLRFVPLRLNRGECDAPTARGKQIRIDSRLDGLEQLDTLVHEFLHAVDWRADEEHVTEAATDIAAALWKLGYRRTE